MFPFQLCWFTQDSCSSSTFSFPCQAEGVLVPFWTRSSSLTGHPGCQSWHLAAWHWLCPAQQHCTARFLPLWWSIGSRTQKNAPLNGVFLLTANVFRLLYEKHHSVFSPKTCTKNLVSLPSPGVCWSTGTSRTCCWSPFGVWLFKSCVCICFCKQRRVSRSAVSSHRTWPGAWFG